MTEESGTDYLSRGLEEVARELSQRARREERLSREAKDFPVSYRLQLVCTCRHENTEALREIVEKHGWPSCASVDAAGLDALRLLLHADDTAFQRECRKLLAAAVDRRESPKSHLAYVDDLLAVADDQPQIFGTHINPLTGEPYPIRDLETLDSRRADVQLPPYGAFLKKLRAAVDRHRGTPGVPE